MTYIKSLQAQFALLEVAGQAMELDLEPLKNLEEEAPPLGRELTDQEKASMKEGVALAKELTEIFDELQKKLQPLGERLLKWSPPSAVITDLIERMPGKRR